VLFIVADDLNNAIRGLGRTPFTPAPNLQRLIGSGVRFTNAYANCPICLPSRNSFLSGFLPHRTGHYNLGENWREMPLLRDCVMMPAHFKANGYEAYGAGKVHHLGAGEEAWWSGFGEGPEYGPFPWNGRDRMASLAPAQQWMEDTPEFQEFAAKEKGRERSFFVGGRQPFPWENGFGPLEDAPEWKADEGKGIPGFKGWRLGSGKPYRYMSERDRDRLPDEIYTDQAVEFLRRERKAPFFLAVGYMRPHTPFYLPKRYFDLFPPEAIELPPVREGDLEDTAPAHREHRLYGYFRYRIIRHGGVKLWREWLQAYLACIAFVDEQVGRLLAALEASGAAEKTVVVFTSDNGYHMGEKEFLFKDTLWREGSQVPLVIRAPGLAPRGAECRAPVSLADLYPTLNDLCGLPAEPNAGGNGARLDGTPLRGVLARPRDGRHLREREALSGVRGRTGTHHALSHGVLRYIRCANGEEELYDLSRDPREWTNLAGEGRYAPAKAEMRRRMERLLRG
jgi:arylsulfatase A-like enzyme